MVANETLQLLTLIAPINQSYFNHKIIKSEGYDPKKMAIFFQPQTPWKH